VRAGDDGQYGIDLEIFDYSRSERHLMDLATGLITVHRVDGAGSEKHGEHSPNDLGYVGALRELRGHVTFAAGGRHFFMAESGTLDVNESLNVLIDYLNGVLLAYGDTTPACVLFETEGGSGASWVSYGGVFTDLGWWDNRASSAWVRNGYELLLMPEPGFQNSPGVVRLPNGLPLGEFRDQGLFFRFGTFRIAAAASSFLCLKQFDSSP
jgi:hypothetical protein